MHSLPVFLRLTGRPVILVGAGDAADAKRRLLERAGALVMGEEAEAALAIIACDDGAEADAAATRLRARGVLLNVTDRPALCDFTLPAIVDRDPVLIAIGTGGASAGLAKAVRQRIEALLPPGLGALAAALGAARSRMRARWPDAGARRAAIDAGMAAGGPIDPLGAGGADPVQAWLDAPDAGTQAGRVETVILTSADPDDLTLRAARLLSQADLVLHDADVPPLVLDRARADAVRRVLTGEADAALNGLTVVLRWPGA